MHENFVASAIRGIERNGRFVELVTLTATSKWDEEQEESVVPVKVLQTGFEAKEIDGSIIQMQDRKYLFTSLTEPLMTHRIRDGGVDLEIINVDPLAPGETLILWKVQARI